VPDDPPVLFRWRGVVHRVRSADGPERIGREWWRETQAPEAETDKEDGTMRDYYRVEDEAGGRYWIFREGLFAPGAPPPRWFLHGLFG
jgi:protein ImuB